MNNLLWSWGGMKLHSIWTRTAFARESTLWLETPMRRALSISIKRLIQEKTRASFTFY
jgi:hypothetical protein